ncbi:MAG TPA: hypothetical protein PLD25_31140 [Chloroflexota bacterium]|nr:hypothetical protein [Chloroflexota bacterium]HUM67884.1 hypothetical protein [Chloroflexota bacterium]
MAEAAQAIFYQSVREILQEWNLPIDPWAAEIATQIGRGSTQWQQTMTDGRSLHLIRIYAPIIQREEVFLGSVLLNDFFFKAIPAAAERIGLTHFTAVANDLESAYFLSCDKLDTDVLRQGFLDVLVERLPDLYFADDNRSEGIHGRFNTMLAFYKANIEPFPVFVLPKTLLPSLLTRVAQWLRLLASSDGAYELAKLEELPLEVAASRRINVILSIWTFFFCQDGAEMQSFHKFLANGIDDGRFSPHLIKQAFGISPDSPFDKSKFNKAKSKIENIDFDALAQALNAYLDTAIADLENHDEQSINRYYLAQKMLSQSLPQIAASITHKMQIGYITLTDPHIAGNEAVICRLSGQNTALIQECHIIGGVNTGKKFNQSLKRDSERFSVHTALAAYLANKRLGMQFDGGFPVPKMYNVVFHYGSHSDKEHEVFQRQLDYLVEYAGKAEKSASELEAGLQNIRDSVTSNQDTTDLTDILGPWKEPALETISQLETGAKAQVLALGSGHYRLFIFILPQFRTGSQEGIDFVQKRFSHSRLAAFTLLALLRGLCGSDGPYYYQSLPRLATGADAGVFYVQNRPENAEETLRKYGAVVSFARQVSRYRRGHSLLADWILLAERMLEDPLGVLSDVLRASPVRAGDDFNDSNIKYKRLSSDWEAARGLGVVDSTEYLALYEQLHELAKEMN